MSPSKPENVPAIGGNYVPYFYQAGVFTRYFTPAVNELSRPRNIGPSYHPSSSYDAVPWRPDRIQTVEQVIAHGYFAVPGGDPVTAIISDKKHTSRLGLDDVIGQIRTRYVLYEQNMEELDQSMCEAHNAVFRQVADQGAPADNRQQYSASKMIQGLYEQKRGERQNLWRDVSRLRLALPENAQNYLTAYRKVSALEAYRGDEP